MSERRKKAAERPGLTPDDVVKKIKKKVRNAKVQKVSASNRGKKEPLLSSVYDEGFEPTPGGGVSATAKNKNDKRSTRSKSSKISDSDSKNLKASISQHLKAIIQEPNPAEEGLSFAESIARRIIEKAALGENSAINFVRDTTEGKPGLAPTNQQPVEQFEGEIGDIEVSLINSLLEGDSNE
jgi:hypothetical protein